MAISPWAAIRNSAQPLPPDAGPWAQVDQTPEGRLAQAEPKPAPVFAPSTPEVTLAPQPKSPLQRNLEYAQAQLERDREKDQPYDWSKHSLGGKIGHVFSQIGNIAGNVVAPNVMANIPGTQLNRKVEEGQLAKQVEDISGEQATNRQKEAQAGNLEAETPYVGPQAQGKIRLESAQAEALENPSDQWKSIPGVMGPNGEPVEIEGRSGNIRFGGVQGTQPIKTATERPNTPEQQYIDEYHKLHPDAPVAEAIKHYTTDTQRPPQAIMLTPGAAPGSYTAQNVRPGSTVQPGAVSTSGLSSENVPSSSTRTMIETAPRVLDLANRAEQLINQQIQQLGPSASRWNEFMSGKVGAPNSQFTQLRTNIGLLSTALMRMHVGARGGEKIMEHFQDLIDSSKQSPENLLAALEEIKSYANEVGRDARWNWRKSTRYGN